MRDFSLTRYMKQVIVDHHTPLTLLEDIRTRDMRREKPAMSNSIRDPFPKLKEYTETMILTQITFVTFLSTLQLPSTSMTLPRKSRTLQQLRQQRASILFSLTMRLIQPSTLNKSGSRTQVRLMISSLLCTKRLLLKT